MKRTFLQSIAMPGMGIFLLLIIFGLNSCEKVIDVDLNTAEKKYVIAGGVNDRYGNSQVAISRTLNFDEDNLLEAVSAAIVKTQDGPSTYILTETQIPGLYE